ncbi:MAG: PaaI family thioesterase [Actinomycetes bacterium]
MTNQNYLHHIGLRMNRDDGKGNTVAEVDVRPDLVNNAGMLQGGIVATIIDCAAGMAASAASGSMKTFTADMNVHFLAPGRIGPVRALGSVLRQGKTSVVTEVRVYDVGADNRLMSVATLTFQLPSRSE